MTPIQAAALMGSWIIETGRSTLDQLDVVERGNNQKGRGLSQYTGVRRGPYDRARSAAIARGEDVNSAQWQLRYFVEEYLGLHDRGGSLIGWTRTFDRFVPMGLAAAVRFLTATYFRPSKPHLDRRIQAAQEVLRHYSRNDVGSAQRPMCDVDDPRYGGARGGGCS